MMDLCPCGSGRRYAACCGALHSGKREAKTAEALMRSRYSAYVLRLEAYLLHTWHPDTRPGTLDLEQDHTRWLGLTLRGTQNGRPADQTGQVRFTAIYRIGAQQHRLDEESRFVRLEGRWIYLDALDPDA
ncbi:YchJ family protein [Deinococcus radiomollis]|uniref:YchJ family protein n=1 Tax=Deinococcus radiomollis TaxID=468916 RepID=UPI00389249A3